MSRPEPPRASASLAADFDRQLAPLRAEILAHCYRMLGSATDAQDVSQDAQLRAWRAFPEFDDRGSFRPWIYRIATNLCLSHLRSDARRRLPWSDAQPPADPVRALPDRLPAAHWLEPLPDAAVAAGTASTVESTVSQHQQLSLGFVLLLQGLTAQQRAAFVLREVVGFSAREVAEMLEVSEHAVNSALARARSAVDKLAGAEGESLRRPIPAGVWSRAQEFVRATAQSDVRRLTALLCEDARLCMPPHPVWYEGRAAIAAFFANVLGPVFARRGYRVLPTRCNGAPAFGLYEQPAAGSPTFAAIGLQVMELRDDRIEVLHCFLQPSLVTLAGLPGFIDADGRPLTLPTP